MAIVYGQCQASKGRMIRLDNVATMTLSASWDISRSVSGVIRRSISMYASLRRIKCAPGKAREVAQRIEEQFVPQMRTVSGFVGYYLIDMGDDEIASVSIFQDQQGADDANQRAGNWVKQSLGDIVAGPLEAR